MVYKQKCGFPGKLIVDTPWSSEGSQTDENSVKSLDSPGKDLSDSEGKVIEESTEDECTPGSQVSEAYEGENLVPMVKMVKVDPIRVVPKPNRVDMHHLKTVMLNIIRREIENRENKLKSEGVLSPRGAVYFREVLSHLFTSSELHRRTREDLTSQMALLCLLTLINEHNLNIVKEEPDFLIMLEE